MCHIYRQYIIWCDMIFITLTLQQDEEESEGPHALLREITEERWFPKNVPATVPGVISAFVAILDNVGFPIHKQICVYTVQIHRLVVTYK